MEIKSDLIRGLKEIFFDEIRYSKNLKLRFLGRILPVKNYLAKKYAKRCLTSNIRNFSYCKLNDNSISKKEILNNLINDGLSNKFLISEDHINKILEKLSTLKFKPNIGNQEFTYNEIMSGNYLKDVLQYRLFSPNKFIKEVEEIIFDEQILEIAKAYLGVEPKIENCVIWISLPTDKDTSGENLYGYHYDIDDYKFLKLFVYLNDVDENSGPHSYIKKSLNDKSIYKSIRRRLSYKNVHKRYPNKEEVLTGKKGTGFFEDTYGYHKGTLPKKYRVILQCQYTINKL
ncbi:hypothetical protein [Prochlorococcus sp. MIT 0604]|uniref:hypothetical protein n=1 Tax=Prochlorococcus sp. MIT 0604 TaxID=1501268 RepID=UPI0004F7582F|nr:hypothetical protein [Prochlorococcus sp. MIT 0604]AIQ95314.1 hypothetical protein EW14_1301 [Prochlorococcus sp. MIT 0604]